MVRADDAGRGKETDQLKFKTSVFYIARPHVKQNKQKKKEGKEKYMFTWEMNLYNIQVFKIIKLFSDKMELLFCLKMVTLKVLMEGIN